MVQSQFSLTWDSYKSNICSGFSSLQQNGELVDMTLAAEGHFVKVHQVLIALSSPYLKQLMLSAPCQHPVIFLNNISHATLSLILEYIYTGEVIVPSASLSSFIEAAKNLHIKGLENVVDGSSKGARIEINLEDTSTSGLSSRRETNISEQITLPPSARKIYINPKLEFNPITGNKKPSWSISTTGLEVPPQNIPNYSMETEDNTESYVENTPQSSEKIEKAKVSSNLQFTVSIRGSLQVILNRYIYNLHSSQSSGVRRWRCIDYRNKKCSAFVVTNGNIVMNRANPHNHSFHDKKILDKIEKNAVYSALDDVQNYIDKGKAKDREETMESDFVSTSFASIPNLPETKNTQPLDKNG